MPYAQLGSSTRVHYDIGGSGPPLVLIHGISGRGAAWAQARELVEDRFTVLTPDLSGSGATEDDDGPLSVGLLADEVAAVIEAAGLGPAHVAGHSIGGVVTAAVAGRHPDLVRSAVPHASWTVTDTRLNALFRLHTALYRESPRRFTEMVALTSFHPRFLNTFTDDSFQEWVDTLAEGLAPGTDRQLAVLPDVDNTAELAAITCPALVLASDHDEIIPAEQHQAVLAAIPGAREATVVGGHSVPWEAIATFLEPIIDFVTQVENSLATASD